MPIRRMLRSRKAISPILATLLLIVIAVAAIVVTYAWITTYMGNTTAQAGVLLYKENVQWTSSQTKITIGNSGTGDTRLVRVYAGNSSSTMVEIASTYITPTFTSGVALTTGSVTTLTIAWPNDLANSYAAGHTYYFRIVPNPGQFLEFQEKAPQ